MIESLNYLYASDDEYGVNEAHWNENAFSRYIGTADLKTAAVKMAKDGYMYSMEQLS